MPLHNGADGQLALTSLVLDWRLPIKRSFAEEAVDLDIQKRLHTKDSNAIRHLLRFRVAFEATTAPARNASSLFLLW